MTTVSKTTQPPALPADVDHPALAALFESGRETGSVDSVALKDAIDASLRRHIDDGDLTRIYAKYVSQDLTPSASQTKG